MDGGNYPMGPHPWGRMTVEDVARALYNRWRYQGVRLGLEVKADDSRPWAEAKEGQRAHFREEAKRMLNEMLESYNK